MTEVSPDLFVGDRQGTNLRLHISSDGSLPIYRQIVDQVKMLVWSGRLSPGAEMPSIRALAKELLVNPNTVSRAYGELEAAGVVSKRRGVGTYVSDEAEPLTPLERLEALQKQADALLIKAKKLDVSLNAVVRLLKERCKLL